MKTSINELTFKGGDDDFGVGTRSSGRDGHGHPGRPGYVLVNDAKLERVP